jgi:hypothetical protein
MKKAFSNKCSLYGLWCVFISFAFIGPAHAASGNTNEVDTVLKNIVTSGQDLPGLLSGMAYLLGALFGVYGILKIKEHVLNPTQAPLKNGVISLFVGGALFSLPMIYQAMRFTIDGGVPTEFDPSGPMGGILSSFLGKYAYAQDFNTVLKSIADSFADAPGFIAAGAYLLASLLGITGLLKIKEHVENPDRVTAKEGIIRLLIGGALFSMPTIYEATYNAIGADSLAANIGSISGAIQMFVSVYNPASLVCAKGALGSVSAGFLGGNTLGAQICGIVMHAGAFPAFLTAVGYMIGLVLGVWGVLKIKEHVINPQQTKINEGIMRLLAAGAFFSAPALVEVMRATMGGSAAMMVINAGQATQRFHEKKMACTSGLDGVLYCFMSDMLAPMHVVLNFFAFCAGFLLIMIGISRLIKSAQDGPKGPAGFGTFMTFAAGGALVSYNELMRAATATLFSNPLTDVYATLQYQGGMSSDELNHVHTVISAILKFMIIVGLISFVRGIFIIRGVAEGNSQSSVMAGMTHLVGGALAVNLGPLLNAVQATLGIGTYGIGFT